MGESGRGKRISRRRLLRDGSLVLGGLAAAPSALGIAGCRCGGDEAAAPASEGPQGPAPVGWRDYDIRLPLRDNLHLADVDHCGTFVDFGTAARFKYTLGNWRSGWGADVEEQGVSYTWATASPARCYFHLDHQGPLRVLFRGKRGENSRVSVYVNDQPITRVTLGDSWSDQNVTVDAEKTRRGENSLKLVHSGGEETERSFAIDYLRLIPGEEDPVVGAQFVSPTADFLLRSVTVGELERPALVLRSPTRVSYYLELPQAPWLGFGVALTEGAGAVARLQVTDAATGRTEGMHRAELVSEDSRQWQDQLVDLNAYSGKVVRLDLDVQADTGDTEVAWSTPSVLTRRATAQPGPVEPVRNVVVLLIDTLRADTLTTYSETRIASPEFDRFAREGAVFERCQAPSNWTKPSCASLLTGLHPLTHRALSEASALSSSVRLCSEMFQQGGFQTGAFVANGYMAAEFGFNQGWHHYRNYIRERRPTEAEHVFADALSWLEQNRDQRSLTYIQTIDPHVPYDPPDEDLQRYDGNPYEGPVSPRSTGNLLEDFKRGRVRLGSRDRQRLRALYDGEVTYHDRQFGLFLRRLQELELLDSTLIIATSDHGEEFFEHDSVGHGHSLYQELLHVPLVMRHPGLVQPGQRLGQVSSLVDIVPTVLEATGLPVPDEVEGRSLVPDLRGQPAPVVSAAFSSKWDTGKHRETSWTARVGDWKLRMRGPANSYLYDLSRDPREERDFDEENPLALRAARIALGQFLGAPDKRQWYASASRGAGTARHQAEEAQMSPELCQQLQALGYVDACD